MSCTDSFNLCSTGVRSLIKGITMEYAESVGFEKVLLAAPVSTVHIVETKGQIQIIFDFKTTSRSVI